MTHTLKMADYAVSLLFCASGAMLYVDACWHNSIWLEVGGIAGVFLSAYWRLWRINRLDRRFVRNTIVGGITGLVLAAAARASQSYFTPHEEPSMTYVGIALFGFLGTIIGGGLAIRKRFHIP